MRFAALKKDNVFDCFDTFKAPVLFTRLALANIVLNIYVECKGKYLNIGQKVNHYTNLTSLITQWFESISPNYLREKYKLIVIY